MTFKSAEAINDNIIIFSLWSPWQNPLWWGHKRISQQVIEGTNCPATATDLMRVFEEQKKSGRKALFTYLDLCTLYCFFLRLS